MKFWKISTSNNYKHLLGDKLDLILSPLGLVVDMSKCLNRPVNKLQTQEIIALLRLTQSNLAIDDGFPPDFQIAYSKKSDVKITGNLKTALIVLRHVGLISSNETNESIKILDKELKVKVSAQELLKYNKNYKKACDSFFISSMHGYQKTALSTYFKAVGDPISHRDDSVIPLLSKA